ncbi:zinc finger protein, putative [Pediculus humanus corporis]|uniref:Zinc finger protein, putative n=1 Tax=Pediculus humanus subsp. corporis TaxID=121224 RepID=E0VUG3_PEDHC|nr:zinc finger protein, putative [Pediculus humanus corporis]EEB17019.1 zinc finger protein, putative [Pediculus humanus corporis]
MDRWCSKQDKLGLQKESSLNGLCHCCGEDSSTDHSAGDYECTDCNKKFQFSKNLKLHKQLIHEEEGPYICPECSLECENQSAMSNHLYTHNNSKPWSCERCNVTFTRKYHLDRHILQTGCDGVSRPTYSCQVCGRNFNRKDNLREHLRAHAGVNKRLNVYQCEYCDQEILGAHLYSRHKKEHFGNKPYPCSFCNKRFRTSGAQKKHIRRHTGEKPYECNECFTKFAAKETLNRHRKLHTGVRPFTCKYCGKGFIQASQLRAHVFYHTGEYGFKCDECDKSFNRKTRLDTHKKYFHDGAEPMKCEHCDRHFIRKEDLARHTLTHTGVKAFQCNICSKGFSMKSSLKIHLLTHTKEPPRACNYCNRAFIRQDCLLRHMRAKHRDKLEEILVEAEKKKLQLQLWTITNEVKKPDSNVPASQLKNNNSSFPEAVSELLKLLVDEETLKSFGAPDSPIDKILDLVIKRCGHQPVENPDLSELDRLRENAKLLFTVVIDDTAVKTLLNNQSVDEVISHVLTLAKS